MTQAATLRCEHGQAVPSGQCEWATRRSERHLAGKCGLTVNTKLLMLSSRECHDASQPCRKRHGRRGLGCAYTMITPPRGRTLQRVASRRLPEGGCMARRCKRSHRRAQRALSGLAEVGRSRRGGRRATGSASLKPKTQAVGRLLLAGKQWALLIAANRGRRAVIV